MAIKANNIIVGGVKLPTEIKEEEVKEPSKYIEKKDGDLIRHINAKSHYLKDMIDFEI